MLCQEPSLLNTWKDGFTVTAIQCSGHVTGSYHEYTLSEPTAVTYSPDCLLQNTSPPMEQVRTALIQYKWPEHWLALTPKPVFQVLRSLMHLGSSSLMGENVSRWSQSALFTITVGSANLYLWFDSVSMARTLTCLYGTTGFSGVEVPSDPWQSISHGRKGVQVESVITLCYYSGLKCV